MNDNFEPVGLFRRFAAIFYDFLMLIAVLIIAGFLAKIIGFLPPVLIDDQSRDLMFWVLKISFNLYIYLICYFFFVYPWMKNGQTLGMQAWKIKVVNLDGSNLSYKAASIRFFVALLSCLILGFGFWRALFDKQKFTWHDVFSKTRLIKIS